MSSRGVAYGHATGPNTHVSRTRVSDTHTPHTRIARQGVARSGQLPSLQCAAPTCSCCSRAKFAGAMFEPAAPPPAERSVAVDGGGGAAEAAGDGAAPVWLTAGMGGCMGGPGGGALTLSNAADALAAPAASAALAVKGVVPRLRRAGRKFCGRARNRARRGHSSARYPLCVWAGGPKRRARQARAESDTTAAVARRSASKRAPLRPGFRFRFIRTFESTRRAKTVRKDVSRLETPVGVPSGRPAGLRSAKDGPAARCLRGSGPASASLHHVFALVKQ